MPFSRFVSLTDRRSVNLDNIFDERLPDSIGCLRSLLQIEFDDLFGLVGII